jgi:hypothetical protein
MGVTTPYFRIRRPFTDGSYLISINDTNIRDPRYATDRVDLIRGYHLLEKELLRICDFVEPADANMSC